MARTRLTTFSKFLITLLIVGAIALLVRWLNNQGYLESIAPKAKEQEDVRGMMKEDKNSSSATTTSEDYKKGQAVKVGVVTWGGYAGGQYFNEGFAASKNSRFFKEYGFPLEFKVLDDFDASRAAFKSGDVDLLWATVDAFPTEVAGLKDYDPQIVFQADWSRGGDAVVVRRGINSVADLKGKTIAVAPMTPSHTFLLWLLDAGDLSIKDVKIKEVPNAIDAATAFKSNQVDAAVVWSPDDDACVRAVIGSKVLESTRSASHIIADVFIAKKSFVENNREVMNKVFEGWMRGAAEINASDANKRKAARILADGLNIPEADAYQAINNVRLCNYGDNANFFNLKGDYKGVTGEDLYNKMALVYSKLNYAPLNIPSWRQVANPIAVKSFAIRGTEHEAEGSKEFTPAANNQQNAPAISSKALRINFRTGEYQLDENAKYIIDKEFGDIAKAFANARIRVEGNTDDVGDYNANKALSQKRAQSVADYLISQYGFSRNRFIIIGNGSDNPIAPNTTDDGRAKNRRTDFELISD
ncbi:MAG: phosphate ABC transporter substrate-binding/OmpA family protein [Chitinophagales bacterium]|nr:OmpA family protein [Bacteroidota bacterium]MCB9042305.1 OmpA family protein [Chitinophagales bacterium]